MDKKWNTRDSFSSDRAGIAETAALTSPDFLLMHFCTYADRIFQTEYPGKQTTWEQQVLCGAISVSGHTDLHWQSLSHWFWCTEIHFQTLKWVHIELERSLSFSGSLGGRLGTVENVVKMTNKYTTVKVIWMIYSLHQDMVFTSSQSNNSEFFSLFI